MDQRRAGSLSLIDAAHRLKLLIIDLNELFRPREDILIFRDDKADSVADTARHAAFGDHHVPVLLDVADLIIGHVLRCKHAEHSRKRERLRDVDIKDARPRIF